MQPSGKDCDVFISHDRRDSAMASDICRQLERSGFKCWMAPRDVRPGRSYADEILRGVQLSKCMVVILSLRSADSRLVMCEVERAVSKRKPVLPILIDDLPVPPWLELLVSQRPYRVPT